MANTFQILSRIAKRLGFYDRIRHSWLYQPILKARNPGYFENLDADEAFYRRVLSGQIPGLIFDVGANVGDKTAVFARIAARVVSFEPDPRLARSLSIRFARNSKVCIEAKGVSDEVGTIELHAYDAGSPYNTMNAKQHAEVQSMHESHALIRVPVTTLDEAIKLHGIPDFLKVDVEGHEREVFDGLSQSIPLISFEANLPAFREETCLVARRIAQLNPLARFAVCGSGLAFDFSFPWSCDAFCAFISGDEAPRYIEAFARLSGDLQPS